MNDTVQSTGLTYLKTLQLQALPLQLGQLEQRCKENNQNNKTIISR